MALACPEVDIISEIEQKLSRSIGSQKYKLWFGNSTRLKLDDSRLTLEVPNNFVSNWIENNFSNQIRKITNEIAGREISLNFKISGTRSERAVPSRPVPSLCHQNRLHPVPKTKLRRKLRNDLSTFVVGKSNELAFNTINSIVDNIRSPFNPLFIYGGCGLGKTHLLQGLCNALSNKSEEIGWHYISGEEFTNQFVTAIRGGGISGFRNQYRNVDVLVIDDVHFLANKRATQEEFLHTYNAISAAGKQVVMASDTHPREIKDFHNSLTDRCISGMVVQIDPPEPETRASIIRVRTEILQHSLPEQVVQFIANHITGNVREIEGAILKLFAYSSLCSRPVGMDMAERVISEYGHKGTHDTTLSKIEQVCASYFGVRVCDVHSSKRKRTISLARAVTMYLTRKKTAMSFPDIGRQMGNKNHSTVILACKKIEEQLKSNSEIKWDINGETISKPIIEIIEKLEKQLNSGK